MKKKLKQMCRELAEATTSYYKWDETIVSKEDKDETVRTALKEFDETLSNEYRGRMPSIEKVKILSKLDQGVVHTYIQAVEFEDTEKFCFELTSDVTKIMEWQKNGN